MIPIYNFKNHLRGDTFQAININFGFDLTGAIIQMNFKQSINSKVAFFWSTSDNSISITNPLTGEVNMNGKIINVAPAKYLYDCQITFSDGTVTTYFGGSITILQDITE